MLIALQLLAGFPFLTMTPEEEFRDKVAPILQKHCFHCHSGSEPQGNFSLTTSQQAFAGGESGASIAPGKPDKSLLLDYISGSDPEMPKEAPPLAAEQVAIIRQWIEKGAHWPKDLVLKDSRFTADGWWSLKSLETPLIPQTDSSWNKNEIDPFILAKLTEKGLTPSPEADRRILIRRLSLDLLGLPPTPAEVEAFVNDPDPAAYEKLVDKLLASQRYGERWARHWLDVVHYGDTHGFDKDKRRPNAWRYRDYVIDSFNHDKPYDQFILEQLAGDVLAPGEPAASIATGFIAAGPWDFVGQVELREGTTDKEITRILDRDDMVSNAMSTFMSLTVHCARCHDHPFDPIRQQEYYRLQAVFAGLERTDVDVPTPGLDRQRLVLAQTLESLQSRQQKLTEEMKSVTSPELKAIDRTIATLHEELATAKRGLASSESAGSPSNGYHGDISGKQDGKQWVQIDLGQSLPIDLIDLIPARPTDFADTPGFGFPLRFQVAVSDDAGFAQSKLVADHTTTDFANPGSDVVRIRTEGIPGRYVRVTVTKLWPRTGDFVFALSEVQVGSHGKNIALGAPVTAQDSIEAGRWSTRNLVDGFDSREALPDYAASSMSSALEQYLSLQSDLKSRIAARQTLADELVPESVRTSLATTTAEIAKVEKEIDALSKPDQVYAVKSLETPRTIHVLHRGDVKSPKEKVSAGTVACVEGMTGELSLSDPTKESDRRVALAKWIADDRNGLTWRSIVNRVWHYHFGRGIVDTPNDFGHLGSQPTHPELLDWLAAEFRANGKSLKWLHRKIVTSATYRQVSDHRPEAVTIDAGNQYLWRMNRRRLDAESIRDSVLQLTGSLDLSMGGPGYDLFGFKDDHSPHYKYDELDVDDPKTHRRSIYRFVVRSVPDPWMECLDCADPSLRVPVRDETITALQALALLNNKFLLRQAEKFAARLQAEHDTSAAQIAAAYRIALGRDPTTEEQTQLAEHAKQHGLSAACRVLLNTSELMFVD